jgi:ATP-dependent DNA helicase DinG
MTNNEEQINLPDIPVVILEGTGALWISPDGDIEELTRQNASVTLAQSPVIVCNAPLIRDKLNVPHAIFYDVLELFAFVHPARFCVPTANGICKALDLPTSTKSTQQAVNLISAIERLLQTCTTYKGDDTIIAIAHAMAAHHPIWSWSPFVLSALGVPLTADLAPYARENLKVWQKLPEWSELPELESKPEKPITQDETRQQLYRLVDAVIGRKTQQKAEPRQEQVDYASALTTTFIKQADGKTNWVMAEAGTGVGKTLGYLAPSLAWSTKNDSQVWISTYTRHLQNQLQHDLDSVFPRQNPPQALIRKGRENYLCLLNLDENIEQIITGDVQTRIGFGLMLRWIMVTRDGDLTGGDLPGWLPVLVGAKATSQLADRRGECIHQSCPHYKRCFIERVNRDSRSATVVVANHALTLTQICDEDEEMRNLPKHLIFDEGHHLFEAADNAFSVIFSGQETAELKRWLIGDHTQKRLRRRGLNRRMINLVGETHPLWEYVPLIREAASFLPEPGWMDRIHKENPQGLLELFFNAIRHQVLSHADFPNSPYDLECSILPLNDSVEVLAKDISKALQDLYNHIDALKKDLLNLQKSDDSGVKRNVASFVRSLETRILNPLSAWITLVRDLQDPPDERYVDWFGVTRTNGKDHDIGIWRHAIDPMHIFVEQVKEKAQTVIITSATLKPAQGDNEKNWLQAEQRLGGTSIRADQNHPLRIQITSPFNYAEQTKVILITDNDNTNINDVANSYATLFKASGGGALGLFTAINRLRTAYPIIAKQLVGTSMPLYAQHIDGLNTATLIDIFRAEEDACLLGTDALRDGIDVPGRALRLVVYDRIPWPRPHILHKARRQAFGARDYDLFLTSMRLRQSFGRLIRTADDRGVFVLLESALPSALYKAFPDGVVIEKLPLSSAINQIQGFLNFGSYAIK